MLVDIPNPVTETVIFTVIFLVGLVASFKIVKAREFFSKEVTTELKGLAILTILFGHIGYFISKQPEFLFPLSILSGVGVNLFLFLSGFGLTVSEIKNPLSPIKFYQRRLLKIFIPLWIVLTIFFLMDILILHRSYQLAEMIQNYLGFFPKANLVQSLSSPLWYFTPILFYYLLFPVIFIKKFPWLTPLFFILIGSLLLSLTLPVNWDVEKLYKLHFLAFPLGISFALISRKVRLKINPILKALAFSGSTILIGYTAIYSGVGSDLWIEHSVSLVTTLAIVCLFSLYKVSLRLFYLFGAFSYEIYLIHWPILSRYNLFYGHLPASLATVLYLGLFLGLAFLLNRFISLFKVFPNRFYSQNSQSLLDK